jgi:hypothetical protein
LKLEKKEKSAMLYSDYEGDTLAISWLQKMEKIEPDKTDESTSENCLKWKYQDLVTATMISSALVLIAAIIYTM